MSKTVRCSDFGLFGFLLEEIQGYKKEYFAPWEASFPTSDKKMIGDGIPGIKRREFFEAEMYTDKDGFYRYKPDLFDADLYVYFDIYKGPMQSVLRAAGKPVFGSGEAEQLEIRREYFKEILKKAGLPNIPTEIIEGIDTLREYFKELSKNSKLVIKSSCFRGDQETEVFDGKNNTVSEDGEDWINTLATKLGVRKEHIEFLCEDMLDKAVEPGYDGVCSDGVFGDWGMVGYEKKDEALIGKWYRNEALPKPMKQVNDGLSPILKKLNYRGLYTIENFITKSGKCYPGDFCGRAGSPSAEGVVKSLKNWTRVIEDVANGRPPKLEIKAPFVAIQKFTSEVLGKDFDIEVRFPKEIADSIIVYNKYMEDGKTYSISQDGNPTVGAVVSVGNSVDAVVDKCKELMDKVHCKKLCWGETALDEIKDSIQEGRRYGIIF